MTVWATITNPQGSVGQTPHHQLPKTVFFYCSKQLRLTEIWTRRALSRLARSSTGKNLCQSELQGIVDNRSLVAGGMAFDILRCLMHDHLLRSEYSLEGKYEGKVTTTTENGNTVPSEGPLHAHTVLWSLSPQCAQWFCLVPLTRFEPILRKKS